MQTQQSHLYLYKARHMVLLSACFFVMAADTALGNEAEHTCWVADFREMALTTHNVQQRETKALAWLTMHAGQCTEAQLLMISSNRPSWMGNADTVRIAAHIDRELEKRFVMSQRDVSALCDSEDSAEETTEITTTPAAPPAVVPSNPTAGTPDAVIVRPPAQEGGGS